MIEIKEQYIVVDIQNNLEELNKSIAKALEDTGLNNILIPIAKREDSIESLVVFLENELHSTNGLACFVGLKELMTDKVFQDLNHVIALPTEHEGVEAIMMNILENEFLKGE